MPNRILPRAIAALRRLFVAGPQAAPPSSGRYDRLIDAANRLPRPLLTYATLALLALSIFRPDLFDRGMDSLSRMPDELWWLIGAILAGHFGAREAHHLRHRSDATPPAPPQTPPPEPLRNQGSDGPA